PASPPTSPPALHDALPICPRLPLAPPGRKRGASAPKAVRATNGIIAPQQYFVDKAGAAQKKPSSHNRDEGEGRTRGLPGCAQLRSEEHTSELTRSSRMPSS